MKTVLSFCKRTYSAHWHGLAISGSFPPDLPDLRRTAGRQTIVAAVFYGLGAADLAGLSPLLSVVSMIAVKPFESDREETSRGGRKVLGKARAISRRRP